MKVKKYRYFMCDFETTVYKGQVNTEVWASASVIHRRCKYFSQHW